MKIIGKYFLTIGMLLTASSTPFALGGAQINGVDYIRLGASEAITVDFDTPDAATTVNSYYGMVELFISGSGESAGQQLNDAFWIYTDLSHNPISPVHSPTHYQLTLDNGSLISNNPAQDAKNFIVYDRDAAAGTGTEVTPTYIPAYRPDHKYNIVIDMSLLGATAPEAIHFGVSDGSFGDNTGSFGIVVFQLNPIPEPATLLLFGLGGLALRRRRRA